MVLAGDSLRRRCSCAQAAQEAEQQRAQQIVEPTEKSSQFRRLNCAKVRVGDDILCHVVEAERAYARKIGVRHKPFEVNYKHVCNAMRGEIVTVLSKASSGDPWFAGGWNVSYAIWCMAWHVVDHLWERPSCLATPRSMKRVIPRGEKIVEADHRSTLGGAGLSGVSFVLFSSSPHYTEECTLPTSSQIEEGLL